MFTTNNRVSIAFPFSIDKYAIKLYITTIFSNELAKAMMGREGSPRADVRINRFKDLEKTTGVQVEMIEGVPVCTVETNQIDSVLGVVLEFFGPNTVLRVINGSFIKDAIIFGTDKARVDDFDFRRVQSGSGYDIAGVEKWAQEHDLQRSDVFCGNPYRVFMQNTPISMPESLGTPVDRSALLIYDGTKLAEVPETDGYIFIDKENKKGALLGVVQFTPSFSKFESGFQSVESVDEKIRLLEAEVSEHMNTKADLEKGHYIAFHIVDLLYNESVENRGVLSEAASGRIERLKKIADDLNYEIRMIDHVENFVYQLASTRKAYEDKHLRKMERMRTWPDFVINTIHEYFEDPEFIITPKYQQKLLDIIEQAKQCKEDLGIGLIDTEQ